MEIKGMMCGHCEARVKKALEALPEVTEAIVSHEAGTAVVKAFRGSLRRCAEEGRRGSGL